MPVSTKPHKANIPPFSALGPGLGNPDSCARRSAAKPIDFSFAHADQTAPVSPPLDKHSIY